MQQVLRQVRAVRVVPRGAPAAGWFRRVVRPLLSPPSAVGAAILDAAPGHAGLRGAAPGRAYPGLCFAGGEGGCPLSLQELRIADRVAGEPMSWEVPAWQTLA